MTTDHNLHLDVGAKSNLETKGQTKPKLENFSDTTAILNYHKLLVLIIQIKMAFVFNSCNF